MFPPGSARPGPRPSRRPVPPATRRGLRPYTITGYDASAHMSEETRQTSRTAALGMIRSVVFGLILLTVITFALPVILRPVRLMALLSMFEVECTDV